MSNITAKMVADLREKTGLPMMEIKKALSETNGDEAKAIELMHKKGLSKAEKRAERETKSGRVETYLHSNGRIGVLVEVLSETDFVAKSDEFREFIHNLALQIAGMAPKYVSREDIPAEILTEKKKKFAGEISKPADITAKIVSGKLEKFYSEICLLDQKYIKDEDLKISDLLSKLIAKIGEKIVISRFCRFEVGAGDDKI